METAQIRHQLHKYIDGALDDQIQAIYSFIKSNNAEKQTRISIDQYNTEIEESEHEYEIGNLISHVDLKNEISRW